ncbi:unnamed protein product [Angiostrongylus costaricensis]|uniref:Zinc metalloproteinase n=1 Tax=Angiostrongylus costaricensis TaxID=334426 RepID=A0A0R3PL07_ANGCS|nr:unnamed protein product [Angiostrongylus costaricensis]
MGGLHLHRLRRRQKWLVVNRANRYTASSNEIFAATDKVIVVEENQCWADLGRMGGEQFLSLTWNATVQHYLNSTSEHILSVGSAVHEIGHVLGFFHTMCRYDRDRYIKLVTQNINLRVIRNFQKISPNYSDVYGLGYDYGSIMHYDDRCDSVNGGPTIIATDTNYQKTMGSDLISFSDIFVINEHYGCNAICNKSTSAKCANEGFPHPRNCSICICPSGYGGPLCDKRPPGCGEDLMATNKKKMVNGSVGFGSDLRDHFDFCNYMISFSIQAPKGKKIVVDLEWVSYGYDRPGCIRGGVEIKAQKDQKLTGPIVSSVNPLPLILFNRQGTMQTRVTYRYID